MTTVLGEALWERSKGCPKCFVPGELQGGWKSIFTKMHWSREIYSGGQRPHPPCLHMIAVDDTVLRGIFVSVERQRRVDIDDDAINAMADARNFRIVTFEAGQTLLYESSSHPPRSEEHTSELQSPCN